MEGVKGGGERRGEGRAYSVKTSSQRESMWGKCLSKQ